MNASKSQKPQRSGALDLLRFLAVLTVFFSHYTDTFNFVYQIVPANLKYMFIFKYGSISLLAFFMVSGYVITMTSMNKNIKDFIVTRLSRIYPLFWVSCITAFILPRLIHDHTYIMFSSFKTFLANMTMLPMIFGAEMINPVYHTLVLELLFYLFIAIIIIFNLWKKIFAIIGILTIYSIYRGFNENAYSHVVIPPFAAGMLFYFMKIEFGNKWQLRILLFLNLISSLMISRVLIKYLGEYYKNANAINIVTVCILISAIYLAFYLIVTDRVKIRSTRLTIMLGEIAYPVYLFHIYFFFIYYYYRGSVQGDILLMSILILIIFISWILNNLVEKPLVKLCSQLLYYILNLFKRNKILSAASTSYSSSD